MVYKKLKTLLLVISFLAICFSAGTTTAAGYSVNFSTQISATPQKNQTVTISITATPLNDILLKQLNIAIDGPVSQQIRENKSCQSANTCTLTFTVTPTEEGSYVGMVWAIDINGRESDETAPISFIVTSQGGNLPPPSGDADAPKITGLEPSTIHVGQTFSITGQNLCEVKDSPDLGGSVLLSQGGKNISVNGMPNDDCTNISAVFPESHPFSLDNNINVSVKDTLGRLSNMVNFVLSSEDNSGNIGTASPYYTTGKLLVSWPKSPAGTSLHDGSTLPDLIKYLYEWGISLGGLAVFISLIIAGVQYLTSFGDPVSMKNAMERIRSAIIGLVVLLASWLILNTINPDLTTFYSVSEGVTGNNIGACTSSADCNKGETCSEENFCVIDLTANKGTPCTSVTVSGYSQIGPDACKDVAINENGTINFSVSPSKVGDIGCLGYLEAYPDPSCQGDKQMMVISGQKDQYANRTTERIRSIKFKQLETDF